MQVTDHNHGPLQSGRFRRRLCATAACLLTAVLPSLLSGVFAASPASASGITLNGVGSSFAAPAIEQWGQAVGQSPYSLGINYESSSSGDGRYKFSTQTADFAASDIAYGLGSTDTSPPTFPFIYVPITAGGIAFMYNIPGLSKPLQLTSYTACAILTGGITNWNSPLLEQGGANSGSNLSSLNVPIVPVTESDSAGTNFVLEEWCINEQSAIWTAFANHQNSQSGGPTDGVTIQAGSPNSNWPGITGGLDAQSTSQVAGDISTNPGGIGAVQVKYATDLHYGTVTGAVPVPAHGVAAVQNASGDFTEPTPVGVASALAYATQLSNGTHKLNFGGAGPNVYNPSTYSYLLARTTGWPAAKGAVLSGFVNYVLTLGQKAAPSFGYASLGLSLEQYGITEVTDNVPGAAAPAKGSAEDSGFSCGDLTPTEVQAGQTAPTCGVTNVGATQSAGTTVPTSATSTTPTTTSATKAGSSTATTTGSGTSKTGTTSSKSGATSKSTGAIGSNEAAGTLSAIGSGSSGGVTGSGVDPSVALSSAPGTMAQTGGNPVPIALVGGFLFVVGWRVRRKLLRVRGATK